jgi:hypothetical protein
MLSSMSGDDVNNFGTTHLFTGPDSSNTWVYNNVEATGIAAALPSRIVQGNGLTNNFLIPKASKFQAKPNAKNDSLWENANAGAFQRMTMINDRPDDIYVAANVVAGGSTT